MRSKLAVSLALGGGGARGIAHLGVLRYLNAHDVTIKAVAGTSAGGIVAALMAAGYSADEMLERFRHIDQSKLYARRPGDGPSLLGVAGINQILHEMLGERRFEDMHIPLSLTAVDFYTGEEIILNQGRVVDAVLATIALPGVFPPQPWGKYYLVDGGLLDPVPVVAARRLAPRSPVVAVVLSRPHPKPVTPNEAVSFIAQIPFLKQIVRLRVGMAFNIFMRSLEIASIRITETRLRTDRPDVIIRPHVEDVGLLDRVTNFDVVVSRGEEAAQEMFPALMGASSWRSNVTRWLYSWRAA